MYRILVVEDDDALRRGIVYALKKEGYETEGVKCLKDFKEAMCENIHAVLLDVTLPDGDSRDCLSAVRCQACGKNVRIPVIFLTARNTERDMIRGFDAGADDYVTKPFSINLLLLRLRALLRRTYTEGGETYRAGDLSYDIEAGILKKKATEILLSKTEQKLLEALIQNRNQVMTWEVLLEKIWDIDGNFVDKNTLSVNIARLRKKVEEDPRNPRWILNVFGIGYKWSDKDGG